jgi:hypothetical protein
MRIKQTQTPAEIEDVRKLFREDIGDDIGHPDDIAISDTQPLTNSTSLPE